MKRSLSPSHSRFIIFLLAATAAAPLVAACKGADGNDSDSGGEAGSAEGGEGGGEGGEGGQASGGKGGKGGKGGSSSGGGGGSDGVAGSGGSGTSGGNGGGGTAGNAGGSAGNCWTLPSVTSVRIWPRAGQAAKVTGGRIEGSNDSPTNGFVELARITAAPAEGSWTTINIANPRPFRFVKYYAPNDSYGALAEIEFQGGTQKLPGAGFGTAGSRTAGTSFDKALDGKTDTFFEGPLANDNYVGLDLADGHVVAAPTLTPAGGRLASGAKVTIATATSGAMISYTTNGSDPKAGMPYAAPVGVSDGAVTVKAIARKACMLDSAVTSTVFRVGAGDVSAASSIHIGNSLTDTIDGYLEPVARSGGVTLDFQRYTIPGSGVSWLWEHPTGGFGQTDVKQTLSSRAFDHISFQPFPNGPCSPDAEVEAAMNFYNLQTPKNPDIQVWVYQQWPSAEAEDCFAQGAGWAKPPWNPPKKATNWDEAVENHLLYQEAVRAKMEAKMAGKPRPGLIPAGLALLNLKREIAAGRVPGMSDFFQSIFTKNGTDFHLSNPGRYFVAALFYTCMFAKDPRGVVNFAEAGVTTAQNNALLKIVWDTASAYPFCL